MRKDVYETITKRITDLLDEGTVPWHKPWGGVEEHPRNLVSGRKYRGINTLLLSSAGYASPYWLTYKQAAERDGHVKKGEKGLPCVYWNWVEKDNPDTGEPDKIPFLRYYTVFNVEQCDNIEYPQTDKAKNNHRPMETCEQIVANMPNPPAIHHRGHMALYNPIDDYVQLPQKHFFDSPEEYFSALYHELTHASGSSKRLSRPGITQPTKFGSDLYCREELIAEMGASFLCGYAGIENSTVDNSAAYIDAWRKRLNGDSRLVVTAGAQAQKAVDYILGENYQNNE